jgi:hypothetical protein
MDLNIYILWIRIINFTATIEFCWIHTDSLIIIDICYQQLKLFDHDQCYNSISQILV